MPYVIKKELDDLTGLYYFGARWYDPELGVWGTSDPAYYGLSPYAYSFIPLSEIDKYGYTPISVETLVELEELVQSFAMQTGDKRSLSTFEDMYRTMGLSYLAGGTSFETIKNNPELLNPWVANSARPGSKKNTWDHEFIDLQNLTEPLIEKPQYNAATNTGTSGYTDLNFLSINPVGTGTGAVIGGLLTGGNPLGIGGGALLGSMGIYGGVMVAADGTAYPYLGVSLSPSVGPSYGGGLTLSHQSPSEGFNIAVSASAGFGGQVGYTFGENGGGFMEFGPMTPGAGVDFFWSWEME